MVALSLVRNGCRYSQNCCVQAPPIGAQIPQLGLQQNSPAPQTFEPHGSPPQNSSVQAPPIGAQIPQLGLQQYSPAPQTFEPHGVLSPLPPPLPLAQALMHCPRARPGLKRCLQALAQLRLLAAPASATPTSASRPAPMPPSAVRSTARREVPAASALVTASNRCPSIPSLHCDARENAGPRPAVAR